MLCERCGTDNPDGSVVCIQCYWALGVPYTAASVKGGKKKAPKDAPAWAAQMGLTEAEVRQVLTQIGDAGKDGLVAYWFNSREDATEAEKALGDTIGGDIKAKKVKLAVANVQGRTALFIAGKADAQTVQMACEAFGGQQALTA